MRNMSLIATFELHHNCGINEIRSKGKSIYVKHFNWNGLVELEKEVLLAYESCNIGRKIF